VSFNVPAEAYLRFMGRYSNPLAEEFVAYADVPDGADVLDVGCGPGMLTERLVARFGPAAVSAIDPSPPFVEATRSRFPDVNVRQGVAEALPYDDDAFGGALAQLVVHFMTDPVAGLREMGRVTRSGGVVAACVWDNAGASGPLSLFWRAARDIDPSAPGEADRAGSRKGHLAELADAAGLLEVESSSLTVHIPFESYDEWWAPYELGVGPAGDYLATLDDGRRERIRERCAALLPDPPFDQVATAWSVRARA
jgi:trans-aconitate methyltransferase